MDTLQSLVGEYHSVWPMVWISRFAKSYQEEQELWEKRVEAGHQPDLPLTSVHFILGVSAFYLTVTFVLHRYMKVRESPFACKPFKSILLVYNFLCVLLAGYVVWGIGHVLIFTPNRKFVCNSLIHADSAGEKLNAGFMAKVFWVFYAQKFWEFLDTWFFLLRKSFRQVTFLHVFHHCSICVVVGLILPFEFNGDMYLPIFLNALVHVLMYSHYLVSALGLSTPWKPYLTSMQLLQFVTIAVQSWISLSHGDSCGAPFFAKVLMVIYMGSMLILFGNFFLNAYVLKKPSGQFSGVFKKMEPIQTTRSHSGRVILDSKGMGRVELPGSFSGGELTYQVTPIGRPMPNLHIAEEKQTEQECSFLLNGGVPNQAVSYQVIMVLTLLGEKPKPAPSCCASPLSEPVSTGRATTPRGGKKSL